MSAAGGLPAGSIVLVGFMGSGKSEVGRVLAQRTARKLIDVDDLVTAGGSSINEIFATEGEAGFRRREKREIARVSREREAIIATGGGSVLDPANVKALKRAGVLVYLQSDPDELAQRLVESSDRPMLRSAEGKRDPAALRKRVTSLLAERLPVYEAAADITVTTTSKKPEEIAGEIVRRLTREERAPLQRLRVALDPPYNIVVGRGILGNARDLVKLPKDAENACIVSHPRIRKLWGTELERNLASSGLAVSWATFRAGEEQKTLEVAARLSRAIARAGLHRGDVVFALGGGVVGDVGAFVASTYARGVAVVQVPTTLLAMVDASIGGKTGVNLPQGKNLVGTFHQPIGVLADLDTLSTLPERESRSALAEVIKYGFIWDPSLIDLAANNPQDNLHSIVVRCAKIKADVVASDEKEEGLRAILNYGHTLGHAIEALSVAGKGKKVHHGEAIAIGMVYAAAVSKLAGTSQDDLVDETRRALAAVGLPTRVEGVTWNEVRDRMMIDKKYSRGLRFVLLEKPGKPVVTRVAQKVLERAFAEVAS
jgi:3-dehydroquinate synthase